jgi:hopanoid biosynthesis associated RND transporter like protein HpnN
MILTRPILLLAGFAWRRPLAVCFGFLALLLVSLLLAFTRLGITTDTAALFDANLPWQVREAAFNKAFPQFEDLLVAVVDGVTPEIAETTANDLAARLEIDKTHIAAARRPDAAPYLERNAFLFLDTRDLAEVLDRSTDAQPFLGQLAADPSARGLFSALALLGVGVARGDADLTAYDPALRRFHQSLVDAERGHPVPLSWQRLLGGRLPDLAGPYRIVLVNPVLNHAALEAGADAQDAIRAEAAKLEFVKSGLAHVRITGPVALADEEFATVAEGALGGTIASGLLVVLWLVLALRSWRLILPLVATLIAGLTLTTGFAALAVGTLNLISVAFAVLFVGLAVDLAIQFGVRYRDARGADAAGAAMEATAREAGPQITIAALAAAAGFLAFTPTDFRGVAELGLIAGGGMVIALLSTLTLLPALLRLTAPRGGEGEVGFAWAGRLERRMLHGRRLVLGAFAALAVAGLVLAPRLTFDSDPLHTKVATTEAMLALRDLMDQPATNPYSADILAANADEAAALVPKLRALRLADEVLTLGSFVPEDQEAKMPLIADAAGVLAATLAPRPEAAPVRPEDLRLAAHIALAQLLPALPKLAPDNPVALIADDLARLRDAPDATLMAMNEALVRFLPAQLARLRQGLAARKAVLADVPEDLARDWRLPDGRVRVQVLAKPEARDSAGLHEFVREVRAVAPDAGGSAVQIVETADTIIGAFRTALAAAFATIAVLLAVVLRRATDVALVLGALVLSALMTAAAMVALRMPLNFANIIALPLLQGVGVSFNIYFVMNWRAGARRFLGTATARAILFSALTTGTAFGSLAFSLHPGTSSMGVLLLLSLGCTLLVTFFAIPALLARLE